MKMVSPIHITISLCVFVTFSAISATFLCMRPQITSEEEQPVKKTKSPKCYPNSFSKWPKIRSLITFKNKLLVTDTQKKSVSLKKNRIDQEDANISLHNNMNAIMPPLLPIVPEAINMIQSEEYLYSTPLQSFRNSPEATDIEDDNEFHSARFKIPLLEDEENRENIKFETKQNINDSSQVSDSPKSIEITQDIIMNNQDLLQVSDSPKPIEITQDIRMNNQDFLPVPRSPIPAEITQDNLINNQNTDNFFLDAMELFYSCLLVHPVLCNDTAFLTAEPINRQMNHVLTNWACHILKRRPYARKNAVIDDISKQLCGRLSKQGLIEIQSDVKCMEVVLICSEKYFTRLVDPSNVYTLHSKYGRIISPPKGVDPPPENEDEYEVIIYCPYCSVEDTRMSLIEDDQQNDLLGTEPIS